jgi:hypothetical protein
MFLTSVLDGGKCLVSCSSRFAPQEKNQVTHPLVRRKVSSRAGNLQKNLYPSSFMVIKRNEV